MEKENKNKNNYKPKSFTPEIAVQIGMEINEPLDDKRTLFNVLKQAYKCSREDSYNLTALRALILEAFWMGKRMRNKLGNNAKRALKQEMPEHVEEFMFSVDWNEDMDLSQGNWD